jgi:hypothetical protein
MNKAYPRIEVTIDAVNRSFYLLADGVAICRSSQLEVINAHLDALIEKYL